MKNPGWMSAEPVPPLAALTAGLAVLAGSLAVFSWMQREARDLRADGQRLAALERQVRRDWEEMAAIRELKEKDRRNFKSGFRSRAQEKRTFYESGLSLQEERRILEKVYEFMATWLRLDPENQRLSLMRADHSLQDFRVAFSTPQSFGAAASALPASLRITSKERFAHPERGKAEEVNGVLTWTPPQVGTSVRSNALGEFVMFTNSPLILHGPPQKATEHASFPHLCLGLSRDAARKIYGQSFIGTRLAVPRPAKKP